MKQKLAKVVLGTDRLSPGPWVFARNVARVDERAEPGDLVEVEDRSGRFVGHALFNPGSDIRLRMLSRGKRSELSNERQFLMRRVAAADRLRRKTLRLPEVSDAYRVVHAEGDDLSGLVVDRLGPVLVCEHHALGFWLRRELIAGILEELYPESAVLHRAPRDAQRIEGFEAEEPEHAEVEIVEHGLRFRVKPAGGHKTGYFCDQRDNRQLVAQLARGRDVLDLCCNLGGFARHAAAAGARRVRAVDLDEKVIARARAAAQSGDLSVDYLHADAFDFLRAEDRAGGRSGVVVLDPHKLVVDRRGLERGLVKYADLNALALSVVRPGGILATFSCSGLVSLETFVGLVFKSGRRAGRGLRLLEVLGAAPDHPQRPDFARSRYLKGLILAVD